MNKSEWIPCSKRLPKIGNRVFCQVEYRADKKIDIFYYILHISNVHQWTTDNNFVPIGKVTAWQPLPEPYQL